MLHTFFTQLTALKTFHLQAQTREGKRKAQGIIVIEKKEPDTLITYEKGTWDTGEHFTSSFSWDFDFDKRLIRLSRKRFSTSPPIFLCELIPSSNHRLRAHTPHLCGQDEYMIRVEVDAHSIHLTWDIKGPKKASTLVYCYAL